MKISISNLSVDGPAETGGSIVVIGSDPTGNAIWSHELHPGETGSFNATNSISIRVGPLTDAEPPVPDPVVTPVAATVEESEKEAPVSP